MNREFSALLLTLALTGAGCDQGNGPTGYPDVNSDLPADPAADEAADSPAEVPPDTPGDPGVDPGPATGPTLLYDGPRDMSAAVPGWSPDHPRPIIVFARYSAETTWHVSMAEVYETGVVGGMVTDLVRFWGWGDLSAEAPVLFYEGPLDASARIPGWSSDDPFPVIVLSRYFGDSTWFVSMAEISGDGTVAGMVTDEVKVWGWTPTDPGSPHILCDGAPSSTVVPGWSTTDPPPIVVLTTNSSSPTWWLSMAEITLDGVVGGMLTDRVLVFGW
jgi:hypothetical protein